MNFEADDLLAYVDEWTFRLHDRLNGLTPAQRAAYWRRVRDQGVAAGLPVADSARPAKRRRKPARRASG
jgi:hypothetical protein